MDTSPTGHTASVRCSRCHKQFDIHVPEPMQASLVISIWTTDLGGLCRDCLYKERENDMNVLGPLIAALIMVESFGMDSAIGKDGKSFGPLQITDICRDDVNRIVNLPSVRGYTREDCFDRQSSIAMFEVYIGHYCTEARLGHPPTWEDAARIWNGGPNGWRNPATLNYWRKVATELERRR